MRSGSLLDQSAGTDDYWCRFEARLCTLPETKDDAEARADLVATAWALRSSNGAAAPEAFAELAYRLRYDLGPTVPLDTLADVRESLEVERERLLGQGVSAELLGLS